MAAAETIATYLLIGTMQAGGAVQGVQGIKHRSMLDCLGALNEMVVLRREQRAQITIMPFCTTKRPDWWRDGPAPIVR